MSTPTTERSDLLSLPETVLQHPTVNHRVLPSADDHLTPCSQEADRQHLIKVGLPLSKESPRKRVPQVENTRRPSSAAESSIFTALQGDQLLQNGSLPHQRVLPHHKSISHTHTQRKLLPAAPGLLLGVQSDPRQPEKRATGSTAADARAPLVSG